MICEPQTYPEVSKVAARLRNEYVVCVEGVVRKRKDANPRLATGEVELLATQVWGSVGQWCEYTHVK